jgi:hypothetical protein
MQQTRSPEQHKAREQHLQVEADYGEKVLATEALDQRYLHHASPSEGFVSVAYERFLEMPVGVVLAALWLVGMALVSLCVLMLYLLVTSLA